jgi:hypothetical protein
MNLLATIASAMLLIAVLCRLARGRGSALLAFTTAALRARRGGAPWPVWLATLWAMGAKELGVGVPFLLLAIDCIDPNRNTGRRWPALPLFVLVPLYFVVRRLALASGSAATTPRSCSRRSR